MPIAVTGGDATPRRTLVWQPVRAWCDAHCSHGRGRDSTKDPCMAAGARLVRCPLQSRAGTRLHEGPLYGSRCALGAMPIAVTGGDATPRRTLVWQPVRAW